MSGGESAAKTYLEAQFPWLANPFGDEVLSVVLGWVVGPMQTYLINSATGVVIGIQTSSEQSAIVAAATALQIAQQSGDMNAVNQALANAKAAYASLLQFDGVYNAP
jgi:hypothetical protein